MEVSEPPPLAGTDALDTTHVGAAVVSPDAIGRQHWAWGLSG